MSDNRGGWVQGRRGNAPANPPPANPAPNAVPNPAAPAPGGAANPQPGWTRPQRNAAPRPDGALGAQNQRLVRGGYRVDQVDQLPPAQRRWTVSVQQALGIRGVLGEGKILASAIATAERVSEGKRPAAAAAQALPNVDPASDTGTALAQLVAYEGLPAKDPAARAMTLDMLGNALATEADPAALTELDAQRAALRAEELMEEITGFGMPPWGARDSQRAAAAKVELDLLSIPPADRQMQRFPGSAMPTFWVNRTARDGNPSRSFLCKAPSAGGEVEGIPQGGEVAREGMTAMVASRLGERLGLPMNVPVTHAVQVENDFLPARHRNDAGGTVTCSVQEVRENRGDLSATSVEQRRQVRPEQCAALAMLDLVTLNTDRHHGNLLMGTDGNLVPIDHGACMPEDDDGSVRRIAQSLGASRNVVLSLPGTHEPLSPEVRQRLAALDPSAMLAEQKHQRADIEAATPAMRGKIGDHALEMSCRASLFLKTAAAVEVNGQTLSPATIQIAFANHAEELLAPAVPAAQDGRTPAQGFQLDWDSFIARATAIATEALRNQPLTTAMCLMSDAEKGLLAEAIEAKGFSFGDVIGPPSGGLNNDPLAAALVLTGNAQLPRGGSQADAVRGLKDGRRPTPQDSAVRLATVRIDQLREILRAVPGDYVRPLMAELTEERDALIADPARLSLFAENAMAVVRAGLQQQADELTQALQLGPNDLGWFRTRMARHQYAQALQELAKKVRTPPRNAANV